MYLLHRDDLCFSVILFLFSPAMYVYSALSVPLPIYDLLCTSSQFFIKGEVHGDTQKMITSYIVVFGALSRMVKVRGAYDKRFWIYKRLNNCAAPAPASDDVLVVTSLACPAHKNTSSSTTKTSSLAGAAAGQLFNRLYIQKRLIACTSDLHHSTQRPDHYEI